MIRFLLLLLIPGSLQAQALVVDRAAVNSKTAPLSWTKDATAFVADDFRIGKKGETWMIDRVRVWIGAGTDVSNLTLFGGLVDPVNGKQPRPPEDCDCHGIVRPIKSVDLSANAASSGTSLRPVDFDNVRWSLPGGTDAQFGISPKSGVNKNARTAASNGTVSGETGHLRVFDSAGKFQTMYGAGGNSRRIAIQVWAHLMIDVKFRARAGALELIVKGNPTFDVKTIDRRTMKLAAPISDMGSRFEDADGDGQIDLVLAVPRPFGIPQNTATACLTGSRSDGTPFEGCDLIPR